MLNAMAISTSLDHHTKLFNYVISSIRGREKENGEYFLCKCGRKHHIYGIICRGLDLALCDWYSKSVHDKFESSAFASFEVSEEILDRITKKRFKIHKSSSRGRRFEGMQGEGWHRHGVALATHFFYNLFDFFYKMVCFYI
jgi:hypothetical protein